VGQHGDLLDIIRERTGISRFPELLAEARAHLGRPQPILPDAPVPKKAKVPGGTPAAAARLFAASMPVAGTLADTYLRARGITQGGKMSALRFHPKCWHRDEGRTRSLPRPALIAAVTDGVGVLQGVHRTWLAPDGQGKARVETQRRAMGHLLGNAVRLTPHDDILVVGEGIETMLSLIEAMPGLPVWAALSSGHLGALLLPEGLQRLYIAIDRDPAGRGAAERLSARATEAGISVLMAWRRCASIWQGRSGPRIGIAYPAEPHHAGGGQGTAGQGSRIPDVAVDRRSCLFPGNLIHPSPARPSRDGQAAVKGAAPSRTGGD
jgi:hypothetical protein